MPAIRRAKPVSTISIFLLFGFISAPKGIPFPELCVTGITNPALIKSSKASLICEWFDWGDDFDKMNLCPSWYETELKTSEIRAAGTFSSYLAKSSKIKNQRQYYEIFSIIKGNQANILKKSKAIKCIFIKKSKANNIFNKITYICM